jgi:hypothetical protein
LLKSNRSTSFNPAATESGIEVTFAAIKDFPIVLEFNQSAVVGEIPDALANNNGRFVRTDRLTAIGKLAGFSGFANTTPLSVGSPAADAN